MLIHFDYGGKSRCRGMYPTPGVSYAEFIATPIDRRCAMCQGIINRDRLIEKNGRPDYKKETIYKPRYGEK